MSFMHRLEQWDAERGIPRPADAPHLPAYHAAIKCFTIGSEIIILLTCGVATATCIWFSANFLEVTFDTRLFFMGGMLIAVVLSGADALQLLLPYYKINQRLTHGTAQWADTSYLKKEGFARDPEKELWSGELRLGRLTTGHNLLLPAYQVVRHTAIFGPPGSGKSKTFTMGFLRDWARHGAVIVLDPKGELYEQTAAEYRNVFRLDLQDPTLSDRWNFVPKCKGNAELAHEIASIIIGMDETTQAADDTSKFFRTSEISALTAFLLHLPTIVEAPTPAHINEFIATRDLDPPMPGDPSPMNEEMKKSDERQARLYWGTFAKAKRELQGSILTGLAVRCAPFCVPHAKAIATPLTKAERAEGEIKEIDLHLLRDRRTAIYVVVPEGDASRYATVLATFFGMAMAVLRKVEVDEDTIPVLFIFDEAGNIPIHGLKEMLGVGRGRKVGIMLDYQNLPQVYAQYGVHGGNAILGSVGTMLFLPGLDKETAQYAAERIGKTTVLQHTSVDAPGKKYDNERDAETQRDLADSSEVRRLVRHKQAIAIIDTAPPIKFRYPPLELRPEAMKVEMKGMAEPVNLMDAEDKYREKLEHASRKAERPQPDIEPAESASQETVQTLVSHPEQRIQVAKGESSSNPVTQAARAGNEPSAMSPQLASTQRSSEIDKHPQAVLATENLYMPQTRPETQPPRSFRLEAPEGRVDGAHRPVAGGEIDSTNLFGQAERAEQFVLDLQAATTAPVAGRLPFDVPLPKAARHEQVKPVPDESTDKYL
jgi:type IV secretory pathway TraG/TraD family ATPase VirD4